MRNIEAMSQEIIERGVDAHKGIDADLTGALDHAALLVKATEDAVRAGLVKPLEGKLLLAETRELAGFIAAAAAHAARLHIKGTKLAKEQGLDTGGLNTVGGVVVMGGGNR